MDEQRAFDGIKVLDFTQGIAGPHSTMLLAHEEVPHERVAEAVDRAAAEALRAGDIIRRLRDFVARGETERTIESLPKLVEEASALALVGASTWMFTVRPHEAPVHATDAPSGASVAGRCQGPCVNWCSGTKP